MQGRDSAPLWREAEAACKAGRFQEAAAVLVRQMARTNPPLAAAGAVLIVKRRGWGFSKMDRPGALALAKAIEEGAWLDKWQTARCEKLADRYATQCMNVCWNRGGTAASKRLRLLFEGRNPFTGAALRWGATAGAREAQEVKERASPWAAAGGPADSDDDDEAGESDGDEDFIAPEDEGSESEGDGSESEEGEEPSASEVSETEDDAPSEPEDEEEVHAPAAPVTVLASQAARDALLARHDALQEALQGANAAALQAKAHADALRGSLSALDRQLAVVERRVAHDSAQQAPPAASPVDARPSGAPHSGRLRRMSAPKPAKAPQPETPAGDESESELPPLPAGVVSRKRPAATRADDLEDDVTDDDRRPRAAASRRRRLTYAASDGGDLDDDDDDAA